MRAQRYYGDLQVGDRAQSSRHTVDREHMLRFARRYDPQYFHADPDAAQESIFGDVIASGIYTMALWRSLDHEIAGDIAWICGVAWEDVRFPLAVRPGDCLYAVATVDAKRRSESDPSRGVVHMQYELFNQNDDVVFTALSINLIEIAPKAKTAT